MIIYYIKDPSVCPFSLMQSLMHKQTLHKFFTVSPVGMGKKRRPFGENAALINLWLRIHVKKKLS